MGRSRRIGAQIVAHPADVVIRDACPLAIRTRAMENRIFIVTAGRVGSNLGLDGEIIFQGGKQNRGARWLDLAAGPDDHPQPIW